MAERLDASLGAQLHEHDTLPIDPQVACGRLNNGLRYFLRHNEFPHNAVSAYLEVNVGSLNERDMDEMTPEELAIGEEGEQGLAHVLEHCVFLGTEAYPSAEDLRSELTRLGMSWGGDSNAYTDYRSTVYTLESPYRILSGQDDPEGDKVFVPLEETNIPKLLHMLHQLTFKATFPELLVEREKVTVLSEAAMRNTTEYRIEVSMTAQTQAENLLPHRLPIGLTSIVRNATVTQLRKFYKRWYQPRFMTLYVVGPFGKPAVTGPDRYNSVIQAIHNIFASEMNTALDGSPLTVAIPPEVPPSNSYLLEIDGYPNPQPTLQQHFKEVAEKPIAIALSPLLSRFSLSLQVKRSPQGYAVKTFADYEATIIDMLAMTVLYNRVTALRNTFSLPPFNSIDFDDSFYADQQCAMRGLHVTAEVRAEDGALPPAQSRWFQAITLGFTEALRLHEYGVMHNELQLAAATMLKEFRDAAQSEDSMTSDDVLNAVQQSVSEGTACTSRKQDLQILQDILPRATLPRVSARAKELTAFVKEFCDACARHLPAVEGDEASAGSVFTHLSSNTTLFVCAPGPRDTIDSILPSSVAAATAPTDTPAAIRGLVARVGLPEDMKLSLNDGTDDAMVEGFDIGPSAVASEAVAPQLQTPTLLDRLRQVSSRRAKIVRMVSMDGDEADEPIANEADETASAGSDTELNQTTDSLPAPQHHSVLLPYEIKAIDILRAIYAATTNVSPPKDIDLPEHLVDSKLVDARLDEAKAMHAHVGVPFGLQPWPSTGGVEEFDAETDARMIRCSNGVTVCFKRTTFEPNLIDMSIFARGGKDTEGPHAWRGGLVSNSLVPDAGSVSSLYPTFTYGPVIPDRAFPDPIPCGALDTGMKTMFNSGAGGHSADAILRYCMLWGLTVSSSAAQGQMQFVLSATTTPLPEASSTTEGCSTPPSSTSSSLAKLFELFHLYAMDCSWETTAFERGRDEVISDVQSIPLSLERCCNLQLMRNTFGNDDRFVSPSVEQLKRLRLEEVKRAVIEQLAPPNLHVNIVGDFDPAEIIPLTLRYLASLKMPENLPRVSAPSTPFPITTLPLVTPPSCITAASASTSAVSVANWLLYKGMMVSGAFVHVPEQAHRAYLVLTVPILGKYQTSTPVDPKVPVILQNGAVNRAHPLFLTRCSNVWQDVLNNRLFRRLRDAAGACYSVGFSATPLEFFDATVGVVAATPIPSMIRRVLSEGLQLLSDILQGVEPITASEMEEVKQPIVQSLRSQMRTNATWHVLLTSVHSHRSRKSWASLHHIQQFYQAVTIDDVKAALHTVVGLLPSPLPVQAVCGFSGPMVDVLGPDVAAEPQELQFTKWLQKSD